VSINELELIYPIDGGHDLASPMYGETIA